MNARLESIRDPENELSASSPYSAIGLAIAFRVMDRLGTPDGDVYDITQYILTYCPEWEGSERWTIDEWIEDYYATRVNEAWAEYY